MYRFLRLNLLLYDGYNDLFQLQTDQEDRIVNFHSTYSQDEFDLGQLVFRL